MAQSTTARDAAVPASEPDPSMDDILASIRRILSDEEKASKAAAPGDGVLQLDPSMMVDEAPTRDNHGHDEPETPPLAVMADAKRRADEAAAPSPLPVASPSMQDEPAEPHPHADTLVAPEAAAMAASSVGALMRTLVAERNAVVHRGGPSIEDLVREEIRPLLKGWLDAHLPGMVERLVRAEIERVVGRITG